VSAEQNGTFTVTNSRNGFSKTYAKRAAQTSSARQAK
jgi:hypothetical protein